MVIKIEFTPLPDCNANIIPFFKGFKKEANTCYHVIDILPRLRQCVVIVLLAHIKQEIIICEGLTDVSHWVL